MCHLRNNFDNIGDNEEYIKDQPLNSMTISRKGGIKIIFEDENKTKVKHFEQKGLNEIFGTESIDVIRNDNNDIPINDATSAKEAMLSRLTYIIPFRNSRVEKIL